MPLTKEEKETIITFNETSEPIKVFTYNKALKRKLDEYCVKHPESASIVKRHSDGAQEYRISRNRLSIRMTAPYSEERREKAREYARENSRLGN